MEGKSSNVLVTGTPGVGKTTFCEQLAESCGLVHVDVARIVKENRLYLEWDDEMNCSIFDEEMVLEALKPKLDGGGCVVDFHSCSFLPDDSFRLVVVLRTDNTILFDRLKRRGYEDAKISDNVECEIFQIVLDEARETFETNGVEIMELVNDELDHLKVNVDAVASAFGRRSA